MNVISWNCKNFKTNAAWLAAVPLSFDVLLLQETWLYNFEGNLINKLFPNFQCFSASSMPNHKNSVRGRPYGNTAILINDKYKNLILNFNGDDSRLISLKVSSSFGELLLINVYLPCNTTQNEEMIAKYLGKIQTLIQGHNGPVLLAGDFNFSNKQKVFTEMLNLCVDLELEMQDTKFLPDTTNTFFSACGSTKSWIDHCFSTEGIVTNVTIPFQVCPSDHVPLVITLKSVLNVTLSKSEAPAMCTQKIKWNKMTEDDIYQYRKRVSQSINQIDWMLCEDPCCNQKSHLNKIQELSSFLTDTLKCSIHRKKQNRRRDVDVSGAVNGWNDMVKAKYDEYRNVYLQWVTSKDRGDLYDLLKEKRHAFKYALRKCRRESFKRTSETLAFNYKENDFRRFWDHVKVEDKDSKQVITNCVDGVEGEQMISNYWGEIYAKLFNEDQATLHSDYISLYVNERRNNGSLKKLKPEQTVEIIKSLKIKKAPGSEGLQSEHFKKAGSTIILPITNLINDSTPLYTRVYYESDYCTNSEKERVRSNTE